MTSADQKKANHWINGYLQEELIVQKKLTQDQLEFDVDVDDILKMVKSEVKNLEFVTTLVLDKERLVDLWKKEGVYYVTRIAYDEGIVELSELA